MALILENGNYIKIKEVKPQHIEYYVFKDQNERDITSEPFFGIKTEEAFATADLSIASDWEKSIKDNVLIQWYKALKLAKKTIIEQRREEVFAAAQDI